METVKLLFASGFMPHGFCYLWDPRIVWLHVIADSLIALSYYCIPLGLLYFARRRRDLPFGWVFWLFGIFIFGCGSTHLMEVWTIWHPSYFLSGVVKAATAGVSLLTAIMLVPLIPKAISLGSLTQLQATNRRLEKEIAGHLRAQALLDAPLRRSVTLSLLAAVVLVGSLGFITWRGARRATLEADGVARAQDAQDAMQSTIRDVLDIETSARDFATTGHEQFLEPFGLAQNTLDRNLQRLRRFVADSPARQEQLDRLQPQIVVALQVAERMVNIRRRTGATPSADAFVAARGALDAVRDTIAEMQADEARLLRQHTEKQLAVRRSVNIINAAGSLVGVCFLLLASFAVNREIKISARARAEIGILNSELEQRVQRRTQSLKTEIGERQRVAEALHESQTMLASIFDSATDAIITVDSQQNIVLFNAAAEKMFGCSFQDAVGKPIERFIPQGFRAAHAAHVEQFATAGASSRTMGASGGVWGIRTNGEQFPLEASVSQIESGGRKLFTIIHRDITERQRAEASRLRLAAIVESTDSAILSKDLNGVITSWNKGAERLYGYREDEVLGKHINLVLPPELQADEAECLLQVAGGKLVRRAETLRRRKDGSLIFVSLIVSPVRDPSGQIIGASTIAQDVTERKRTEEQLARQRDELARSREELQAQTRLLQSVLDSMEEGLVAADEQGRFLLWNPAAEKILGAPASPIPSSEWPREYGFHLPDGETLYPAERLPLIRAIRGEPANAEILVRSPRFAEPRWVEASARPMRNSDGAVCGGVVAFRDITARKTAEKEIGKLNNELEQRVLQRTAELEAANQELEAFTYSVSHDLRAPLRHIGGFSKLLVEEFGSKLDPEAQHYLQRIAEGTRKMGQLVDELLNLARVGRHALDLQVTGLDSILQEVVGILKPEYQGREVKWQIGTLPFVECDPTLLKQVFQNLLSNALKFTRPRERAVIEVSYIERNGATTIVVRDNGVGFSMKYADKLFGVFQRLHRSEDFEGTGVGLATVQRIIQKHGGCIWAEAELEKGAAFYFTLGNGVGQGTDAVHIRAAGARS